MVLDILRFNKLAKRMATAPLDTAVSLGDFLTTHRFSKPFIDWYLLPMLGSIWSCPTQQMLAFPVATLVQFCDNHGLMVHVQTMGLSQAIEGIISPMAARVGERWMRGELAIYEEHLFTAVVQSVLLQGMAQLPLQGAGEAPKVLLTTLNNEPHALGLLMAECMFAQMGCDRISLGPKTPVPDLAAAARVMHADIVALSFSSHSSPKEAHAAITQLREQLPDHIAIWAGGSTATLRLVSGGKAATVFGSARELLGAITQWRAAKQAAPAQP
jgi:methanogenic corrinoid protein MtbC1